MHDDDFWAKRRAEAARRMREDPAYAAEVRAMAERIKQERQRQEAEAQGRRAERRLGLRLIEAGYRRLRATPGGQPIEVMDRLDAIRKTLRERA